MITWWRGKQAEHVAEVDLEHSRRLEERRTARKVLEDKYQIGTQVMLKSGGPWMTVSGHVFGGINYDVLHLNVRWFDPCSGGQETGQFPAMTVEIRDVG